MADKTNTDITIDTATTDLSAGPSLVSPDLHGDRIDMHMNVADDFCKQYERELGQLHLLRNNCWFFALALLEHLEQTRPVSCGAVIIHDRSSR